MAERERLMRVVEVGGALLRVCWSPDGTRLAVSRRGGDGDVRAFTAEGRELWRAEYEGEAIHGLAWSPDGRSIAAGGTRLLALLMDAASGTAVRWLEGTRHISGLGWSPDGAWLACARDFDGG